MPLARSLSLLPLSLLCASLGAQETAAVPAEKPKESQQAAPTEQQDTEPRPKHAHHIHLGHHSAFGAYAQGVLPLRDLKESLDGRTGYGLGVQWTHDHGDWHASRTRLEWNTLPESGPVSGARTYAKNFILSWDHLFLLNKGESQAYLVAGIGGARWYLEQTASGFRDSQWTTKPAITAGAGVRLAHGANLEARYVVSSINKTFDANTLQVSLGWRF
ncbi:MAG: outer membrane beta-barrel protein [Acidobacteriota bacterium]|nr:outer membrane beta-barrel protein [Acidobacteriota bacterium]